MNEFEIIHNLKKIINNSSALNLNDDVFHDKKNSLLASIDTYNEDIHYIKFKEPELIIKKVIRSSISDIICKGVDPKYLLISFSGNKKHFNKKNIKLITNSIKQEQKKYNFSLIGGDISSAIKSSFTITSLGFSKNIMTRNSCYKNDDIYVTGNIGDSSIGLYFLKNKLKISKKLKNYFIKKYYQPNLAFGFHRELKKFASSSMDLSDGLLIDLKKLICDKKLGFIIDFNLLPKSFYFNKLAKKNITSLFKHLFMGDDYQILFTAKHKYRKTILKYAEKWNQKITRIGNTTDSRANYLRFNGKLNKIIDYKGYIHDFR